MDLLLDDYPDSLTAIQIHLGDSYSNPWTSQRADFYDVDATPSARFDGTLRAHGAITNTPDMYDWYESMYLERMAIPTDVTIELSGRETGTSTYDLTAEVCMEDGGTPKRVRVYLTQVLDNWPASPSYSRHTFKQAAETRDFTISPGRCKTVERTFTFDTDSMSNQNDIKIIAWAQDPLSVGPAEIYQAAVMNWPFPQGSMKIDWVAVGNPGNEGENSGESEPDGYGPDRICGAVDYEYRIGKFEVTAGQYTEFLNAVAASDTYGLYNAGMNSDPYGCQITQNGTAGNFTYDFSGRPSGTEADWADRPVNFVSWGDAARFANWMHNGQPAGAQESGTTEDGSYSLNGATSDAELIAITREPGALVFLPAEDEWYKAAYHYNDGVTGNYYDYPTSNNSVPGYVNDSGNLSGTGTPFTEGGTDPGNYATSDFDDGTAGIGLPYHRTEVGEWENSESPYGTFDQGGNVWERNEAIIGLYRGLRGGSFILGVDGADLHAADRYGGFPEGEYSGVGFRVASLIDCNGNGVADICDIGCGGAGSMCDVAGCGLGFDCDANGILDECDIDDCPPADDACLDCNWNFKRDECELPPMCPDCPDCNNNDIPDDCDIDPGPSRDCNVNAVPDECDLAFGTSDDCNGNAYPDVCDLTGNGVLLEENFDAGLPAGWTATGSFQITDLCGVTDDVCGGSSWAYAGDPSTCSYGDYEFGELTLPPVTLGAGQAELRFCSLIDTETDWDWGRVRVNGELIWEESGHDGQWRQKVLDLSEYYGQTVTIIFEYFSDTNTSGWLGWQVDNIAIISGVPDCQTNDVPDDCDVDPTDPDGDGEVSDDLNSNGTPDECDPPAPLAPPYPHDRLRNRYISFDPNKAGNDGMNVAFKVTLTSLLLRSCDGGGSPDVEGWSCRTDDDCRACSGSTPGDVTECWTAALHCPPGETCEVTGAACVNDQAGSVGQSWWVGPEHPTLGNDVHLMVSEGYRKVSTNWPAVVHLADCEVAPVATYGVRAVQTDSSVESDELQVSTIAKPDLWWADCVGPLGTYCTGNWACCDPGSPPNGACPGATCPAGESCIEQWPPPDGFTNFQDVTAAVFTFSGLPSVTPTDTRNVDLHGNDAGNANIDPPNFVVNFVDIANMISAYQGRPYPYSDPGDCPANVGAWP